MAVRASDVARQRQKSVHAKLDRAATAAVSPARFGHWRSNEPAAWTVPAPRSDRAQLRQYVTDSRGTAQDGQHAVPQSMHPRS